MNTPVTIQIVGWNSAGELPRLLGSLRRFNPADYIFRYIDNASRDSSVALVRQNLAAADIIQLETNTGFAGGHNVGFARCTTPFVMVLNPDVELVPEALPELLKAFEDPLVAAVQGKLMRDEKIIDSDGIVMTAALNGGERGAGEKDVGQYDTQTKVAATTGACSIYRLEALQKVAHQKGEIFDTDFFAYKEDVDLGWRLRRRGFKCLYVPVTVGYHGRGLKLPIYQRLKDPRTRYSIRNWVWMLVKNLAWQEDLRHELFIDARLFALFLLTLLYPPLFTVWFETLRGIPKMIKKRTPVF